MPRDKRKKKKDRGRGNGEGITLEVRNEFRRSNRLEPLTEKKAVTLSGTQKEAEDAERQNFKAAQHFQQIEKCRILQRKNSPSHQTFRLKPSRQSSVTTRLASW
jgi:hypothetical protein